MGVCVCVCVHTFVSHLWSTTTSTVTMARHQGLINKPISCTCWRASVADCLSPEFSLGLTPAIIARCQSASNCYKKTKTNWRSNNFGKLTTYTYLRYTATLLLLTCFVIVWRGAPTAPPAHLHPHTEQYSETTHDFSLHHQWPSPCHLEV